MELFRDELEIALKRLKIINKEKYTPKKYKKQVKYLGNYIKDLVHRYVIKYDTRNLVELADLLGVEVQIGTPSSRTPLILLKNRGFAAIIHQSG